MKKDRKKHITLSIQTEKDKFGVAYKISSAQNAYFPFLPYSEQEQVICAIQATIKGKKNALIQSPTGTGKTLILLVGALSSLAGENRSKAKIFYLTRTHSQISQVVEELKKTVYKCRVNIIGSRDHMCINKNLADLKGKMLDKACEQLCNQSLCQYREFPEIKMGSIMDLQEYRQHGRKKFFCPYYHSKQSTEKCELTIMPFNYVLDQTLLEKNNLDLKDAVLIFDEAHNVDTLAEEGSSLELTEEEIRYALAQVKNLLRVSSKSFQQGSHSEETKKISIIKQLLQNFLFKFSREDPTSFSDKRQILQKIQCYTTFFNSNDELTEQGVDLGNFQQYFTQWKYILKQFYRKKINCQYYERFIDNMNRIFSVLSSKEGIQHYYVSVSKQTFPNNTRTFNFQCLTPAYTFKRLLEMKPNSIILSSGTMGNFANWERDLQIPFQTQIRVESFITTNQLQSQIWVGGNRCNFQFSYNRKNYEQQYEQLVEKLGQLQQLVPGGIVVAFSNYEIMEKTMKYALKLRKPIFYERKNLNVDKVFQEYSRQTKNQGAFLFIIMRGRFSQGINFSDQLCRCLLVVGVPFLPLIDKRVSQKKIYLEHKIGKVGAEQWYLNQAMRPINQTIGRVIRNKKDYGIVILVDQRFWIRKEIFEEMSVWFQKSIVLPDINGVRTFFNDKPWEKVVEITSKVNASLNDSSKSVTAKLERTRLAKEFHLLLEYDTPCPSKNQDQKLKDQPDNLQRQTKIHYISQLSVSEMDFFIQKSVEQGSQVSGGHSDEEKQILSFPQTNVKPLHRGILANKRKQLLTKLVKKKI